MKLNDLTDKMATFCYTERGEVDTRKMYLMFYDFIGKLPHTFSNEEVIHEVSKAVECYDFGRDNDKL